MNIIENVQNKIINLNNLLDRKIELLSNILAISKNQEIIFRYKQEEVSSFLEYSIKEKQKIIDELINIDDLFLNIFESFSGELNQNKNIFSTEINTLKSKIETINNLDLKIRAEETKNRQISLNSKNYSFKDMPKAKQDLINRYSQNSKSVQ